jgi:hypothetical protein
LRSRITHGVEPELADIIEREWKASPRLRERLVEILEKEMSDIHISMRNEDDFKSANWANIHARKLGETAKLQKLINFLK